MMREKVNGAWKMKNATVMLCYVTNESICVIKELKNIGLGG
jgi:phage-related holin